MKRAERIAMMINTVGFLLSIAGACRLSPLSHHGTLLSGCYADQVIRPDVQLLRLAIVAEGGE